MTSQAPLSPDIIALTSGYNLDNLRTDGVFTVVDPLNLTAGSYFLFNYTSLIDGRRKTIQRLVNATTGAEQSRATSLTGWTAWSAAGAIARDRLTTNRTYYVRTDGNDTNDGSAYTAAKAFRSLTQAWNTLAGLDLATYSVNIYYQDGMTEPNSQPLVFSGAPIGGVQIVIDSYEGTGIGYKINTTAGVALKFSGASVTAALVINYLRWGNGSASLSGYLLGLYDSFLPSLYLYDFRALSSAVTAATTVSTSLLITTGSIGSVTLEFCGSDFKNAANASSWVQMFGGDNVRVLLFDCEVSRIGGGSTNFPSAAVSIAGQNGVTTSGTVVTGSFTGLYYDIIGGAILSTNGEGEASLPGDTTGIADALSLFGP